MLAPSVCTIGAALRTRRLRIGPMGYVVPLYDALRIVEEEAVLTHGRLELGLSPVSRLLTSNPTSRTSPIAVRSPKSRCES